MKKAFRLAAALTVISLGLTGCMFSIKPVRKSNFSVMETKAKNTRNTGKATQSKPRSTNEESTANDSKFAVENFNGITAGEYGQYISGLKSLINVDGLEAAITFTLEDEFDEELYKYISENNIKANVFVSAEFIRNNKEIISKIKNDGYLKIEALSSKESSLIMDTHELSKDTGNITTLLNEIKDVYQAIEEITGVTPDFIRASSGYYDEGSTRIIKKLKMTATSYVAELEAEGFVSADHIISKLYGTPNGSIINIRLDRPGKNQKDTLKTTIKFLEDAGFSLSILK